MIRRRKFWEYLRARQIVTGRLRAPGCKLRFAAAEPEGRNRKFSFRGRNSVSMFSSGLKHSELSGAKASLAPADRSDFEESLWPGDHDEDAIGFDQGE